MSSLLSFPIDLPRLDLAEADLLLDEVEDHQKVYFMVYPKFVGHRYYSAVVLHDYCRKSKGFLKFLA